MIYEFDGNRKDFMANLEKNPGMIIAKFGAEWCKPCNTIKDLVFEEFSKMSDNTICFTVDVDEAFDLYAYMKSKKMAKGIPVIMCWKKGNTSIAPDYSISGADENEIKHFFTQCRK